MVNVTFTDNVMTYDKFAFYQYDYGRSLVIHGLTLPAEVQVHFARVGRPADVVIGTTVNDVTTVKVPAVTLQTDGDFTAYIFLATETTGQTFKAIPFQTRKREKPGDYAPPDEPNVVQELMDKLNQIIATGIAEYTPSLEVVNDMVDDYVKANLITNSFAATVPGTALDAVKGKELHDDIGDKSNLSTEDKSNLVNAINEVNAKPSGGGTALTTTYDNSVSELLAESVQGAVDEIASHLADKANQEELDNFTHNTVNVLSEGVVGDGSDETATAQAALDKAVNQHGVFYIPSGVTVVVNRLTILSKSNFKIVIDGTLKRKSGATLVAGDVNGMLYIANCTDFSIPTFHGDGNIVGNAGAPNPNVNELLYILQLYACDRFLLGDITGINPASDVLLIAYCHDYDCKNLFGHGNNTGRQTLSMYDGARFQFGNIISLNVGAENMPGGVDLEPEANPWGDAPRVIKDGQFGNVLIVSKAEGCFSMSNNFKKVTENNLSPATIKNITIDNLICKRPYTEANGRPHIGLALRGCEHIKVNGILYEDHIHTTEQPVSMVGVYTEGCEDIDLDLDIYNVNIGAKLGVTEIYTGADAIPTKNMKLKGSIKNTVSHGMSVGHVSDIDFAELKIGDVGAGSAKILFDYLSNISNANFNNCNFKKNTTGLVAIDCNEGTYSNIHFNNCDFSGWNIYNDIFRPEYQFLPTGNQITRTNCKGFNYSSTMPTEGFFKAGEYVQNMGCAILGTAGSKYVIHGWRRITTGSGNVINVDWVEDRSLTGI